MFLGFVTSSIIEMFYCMVFLGFTTDLTLVPHSVRNWRSPFPPVIPTIHFMGLFIWICLSFLLHI